MRIRRRGAHARGRARAAGGARRAALGLPGLPAGRHAVHAHALKAAPAPRRGDAGGAYGAHARHAGHGGQAALSGSQAAPHVAVAAGQPAARFDMRLRRGRDSRRDAGALPRAGRVRRAGGAERAGRAGQRDRQPFARHMPAGRPGRGRGRCGYGVFDPGRRPQCACAGGAGARAASHTVR